MPFIPLLILAAMGALGAFVVRKSAAPNFANIAAPASGVVTDVARHVSVLDERWSAPNTGERAAAPWYDFLAGDPADLGYTSEYTGPDSIPGGQLRNEVGPNYATGSIPNYWKTNPSAPRVITEPPRGPGATPPPIITRPDTPPTKVQA